MTLSLIHIYDAQVQQLRDIMWEMNALSSSTRTESQEVEVTEVDEDGNEDVYKRQTFVLTGCTAFASIPEDTRISSSVPSIRRTAAYG